MEDALCISSKQYVIGIVCGIGVIMCGVGVIMCGVGVIMCGVGVIIHHIQHRIIPCVYIV
jgi:hypothetical protein